MLSRFFCYTKLDENTLEHSYKVIPKFFIFYFKFIAVVGIFSWSLDLRRVDNLYSRPLSSLLLCFNPLKPNVKIQILICYPYSFPTEVMWRIC